MTSKQKIILVLIFLVTILTRFVGLDRSPPHLSNDEISIAYDAYSISKTLRDEYGNFLPLSFQSHGTYKAPLAIYLAVPTTILLGNNEYSVRLPSAILGSLTVILLGLLVYELTKNYSLALLTSFVLSITPWHIYTSRMALESNIALFFVIAGIWLFFRGLRCNNRFFTLISFISFALSIYSYHTEWLFTPMILAFLLLLNHKVVFKKPIYYISALLFLVLITPIFVDFLHNLGTTARANTEILFGEANLNRILKEGGFNFFQKGQIILHAILGSYSSYINLGYLFFSGLNLTPYSDPFQSGLFLSPFLLCFIVGLFQIKKVFKKNSKFIFIWIIFTPLVPALTQGGANYVRNLVSVAPYTIAIAIGCSVVWNYLKNKRLALFVASGVVLVSFLYFCAIYFHHFPFQSGENFQYGYKQIAQYINGHYDKYEKIIIDPKFGEGGVYDGVPRLYIPYYTHLDPYQLLKRRSLPVGLGFDKYEIRIIDWPNEKIKESYLYAVPLSNLPPLPASNQLNNVLEIRLPNQKPAFALYTIAN